MERYSLDRTRFYDEMTVFSVDIDEDPFLLFHGTSDCYLENIMKFGLDFSQHGVFSKSDVMEVVGFFDDIGWDGYRLSGMAVLKPFSLQYDFSGSKNKPVFLAETPLRSLLYSTPDFRGGETIRAFRSCFEDLESLLSDAEKLSELDLAYGKVQAFLTRKEDLRTRIFADSLANSNGLVLAIKVPNNQYHLLNRNDFMGIHAQTIPPEWIIATCAVPSDFVFHADLIYAENTAQLTRKRDKKRGVLHYFNPNYQTLDELRRSDPSLFGFHDSSP